MDISISVWQEMFKDAAAAPDSARLLEALRAYKTGLSWEGIDLFLFSEDLDAFFFPPGTNGDPDLRYRSAFKELTGMRPISATEIINIEKCESELCNRTASNVKLLPLNDGEKELGCLCLCGGSDNADKIPEQEGKVLKTICEIMFCSQFKKLEIEKLTLENNILRKNFLQSENLKLLGEMIGAITHDFNNILTGVSGFGQLLQMSCDDPELLDSLSEILNASESGKRIVNFLSRTKKINPEEENAEVRICKASRKAAEAAYPLVRQFCPGRPESEVINITGESASTLTLRPALVEQLFLSIFTRLLKSGADKINVSIDDLIVKIDYSLSHASPVISGSAEDFPSSLLFYELADRLGFDFELKPGKIEMSFIKNDMIFNDPPVFELGGMKMFIYEPDETIARLFEKLLIKLGAGVKIANTLDEAEEILKNKKDEFERLIIDVSYLIKNRALDFDDNKLVISSGWGEYLELEKVKGSFCNRAILKPFTMRGLKKALL